MQSDNYINTKGMIFAMINTGEEYRKKNNRNKHIEPCELENQRPKIQL